ncbi:MAG: DNA-binding protein [Desulfurellales bacterium]|nr:MAG: DNA-binding protein [Desulfurellales bacterium]
MDPELKTAILEIADFFKRFNRLFTTSETIGQPDASSFKGSRYLTKAEAAMILDVSTKTIDRYVRDGRLQKRLLGESVRFLESDVRDLVK